MVSGDESTSTGIGEDGDNVGLFDIVGLLLGIGGLAAKRFSVKKEVISVIGFIWCPKYFAPMIKI